MIQGGTERDTVETDMGPQLEKQGDHGRPLNTLHKETPRGAGRHSWRNSRDTGRNRETHLEDIGRHRRHKKALVETVRQRVTCGSTERY